MYNNKKILAIIPARGGSKGLPRKNIRPLLGKPLIAWTIEEALKSKYLDKVIVSTDDKEIAEISISPGVSVFIFITLAVFNSGLDSIEFLQVSIPVNFEKWDGKSPIPVTYVPLTINDSEVKELVFYYPGGKAEKVSVDTIPPDFPVMVVGINESFCSAADDSGETSLGKFTNSYFVHIEGIRIRKSQWRYEPWWKGKAEVYFRLYDYDAANAGSGNAANWVPFVGRYYPRGGNIFYRCWKWKRFRWRACHSWKTLSLNTEWNYNWFIPTSECNYCLRVMEYDPPFYDGGIDNGCFLVGVAGFVAGFESMNSNLPLSTLLGVGLGLLCKTVINDDYIGERQNFDDAVWWAYHNRGKYINGETIMGTSR